MDRLFADVPREPRVPAEFQDLTPGLGCVTPGLLDPVAPFTLTRFASVSCVSCLMRFAHGVLGLDEVFID